MTDSPAVEDPKGQLPPPDFQAGRLLLQFIVGLVVFCALIAGLGHFYKAQTLALAQGWVDGFGGLGLALAWALLDSFPGPLLPQDLFSAFALLGGLGFWPTVLWSSLGSLAGGSLSWLLARRLARTRVVLWAIQRGTTRRVYHLVERNGPLTLMLGAVTPLPYSVAVWACSATGMSYRVFLLVSVTRPMRIIFYCWLIEVGAIRLIN